MSKQLKRYLQPAPPASTADRPTRRPISRKYKNYKRWQCRKKARALARNWTGEAE